MICTARARTGMKERREEREKLHPNSLTTEFWSGNAHLEVTFRSAHNFIINLQSLNFKRLESEQDATSSLDAGSQ